MRKTYKADKIKAAREAIEREKSPITRSRSMNYWTVLVILPLLAAGFYGLGYWDAATKPEFETVQVIKIPTAVAAQPVVATNVSK